ncbi:UNVERIFIED_CONTAM: hypothetical protein PYX00_005736 [Menopon gallinae]|uniref:CCZ1/INTU/HSP4 first Longin domain-containing protein n=1 Tax=Menopon gallinae TaxID=328185 RepID=A0AAW2HSQ8_9NEOP
MSTKNDIELLNFFIFNSTYAQTEDGEEKKVLYFYPPETDVDSQLKKVGLCEALIKFTASFNPTEPCRSFYTQKTKQFLFQPEPNFWYVMIVSVPCVTVGWNNEYQSDRVQENVYSSLLRQSYRMFQLFSGSFSSLIGEKIEENVNNLRTLLKNFYNDYLVNLKLSHCDILDVFQGISFLPLGKEPFLHVQSFVNLVETTFDPVRYSAFLYNDQLVWCPRCS